MSHEELLAWGAAHCFPFLVLGEGLVLRHGEDVYQRATPLMVHLAGKRIEHWNELLATHSPFVGRVEMLLKNVVSEQQQGEPLQEEKSA